MSYGLTYIIFSLLIAACEGKKHQAIYIRQRNVSVLGPKRFPWNVIWVIASQLQDAKNALSWEYPPHFLWNSYAMCCWCYIPTFYSIRCWTSHIIVVVGSRPTPLPSLGENPPWHPVCPLPTWRMLRCGWAVLSADFSAGLAIWWTKMVKGQGRICSNYDSNLSNYEISWIKALYTLKTVASWIGSKDKLHKI